MKQLQEFFKDQRIQSILDVGCGAGDFIKVLNDTFGSETQLLGIDPGEVSVARSPRTIPTGEHGVSLYAWRKAGL